MSGVGANLNQLRPRGDLELSADAREMELDVFGVRKSAAPTSLFVFPSACLEGDVELLGGARPRAHIARET